MLDNAYNKNSENHDADGHGADNDIPGDLLQTAVVRTPNDSPRFVAPTHSGVDILKQLSELEDLVENTPKRLGIMLRFDDEKFHYLIMKIRANLPEEMKKASKLARDMERIQEETRGNAERMLGEARDAALSQLESSKVEASRLRDEARAEMSKARAAAAEEAEKIRESARLEVESIIAGAHAQAAQITNLAQAQAAQLVSDNEIVLQAQAQANDILDRADQESMGVRQGADDYARDVLTNLENTLGRAVVQIQRGRDMLNRPV